MRANTMAWVRGVLLTTALPAMLSAASVAAASNRVFAPGDGIGTFGDSTGAAVALSGDTAAVGIPQGRLTPLVAPGAIEIFRTVSGAWQHEAFLGPGLPSAFALQDDMLVAGGPQVATFVRTGTTWSRHDVLAVSTSSVALSGDTLLVAGTPAGVYTRDNGAWTPQATLAGDQPGEYIVMVALDGDIAAIVGYVQPTLTIEAYVHFYHRSGETWTLESTLPEGAVFPGFTVLVIAASGDTVLVGANVYVRDDQGNWSLQGTLDPSVPFAPSSIAIDGDRVIAGAPGDDIPGVRAAGTVYIFERSGTTWTRTDHLADPDATFGAGFGSSVALEGDTFVAGSPGAITPAGQAGYASVFDLGTSPPSKVATLDDGNAHANENFGISFGASASTLVAAAPNADIIQYLPQGTAYVFGRGPDGWTLEAELQAPSTAPYGFGTSAAASADMVVVGSPVDNQTGAAFVYTRGDGTWPQAARLAPDDVGNFDAYGQAVAFDGDRIGVGAPRGHGTVYLYTGSGATWPEEAVLVPSTSSDGDGFGSSLALAADTLVVGAPNAPVGIEIGAGLAFVFTNSGSGWVEQAVLESPSPLAGTGFGGSVATQGDTAVIGTSASSQGMQHVYVFGRSGASWTLETTLDLDGTAALNTVTSVAISPDENMIAIGMPTQLPGAGRVLTFVRDGTDWVPARTFVDDGPGNPGGIDGFGFALAFLGENILVGAPQDGAGGAVYEYGIGDAIFAAGFDPSP